MGGSLLFDAVTTIKLPDNELPLVSVGDLGLTKDSVDYWILCEAVRDT